MFDKLSMPQRIYVGFLLLVTVLNLLTLISTPLKEELIEYTGWIGLWLYTISLVVFITFLFGDRYDVYGLILRLGYGLFVALIFGLLDYMMFRNTISTNPYLNYSPYRPLITVCLPLFWLVGLTLDFRGRLAGFRRKAD